MLSGGAAGTAEPAELDEASLVTKVDSSDSYRRATVVCMSNHARAAAEQFDVRRSMDAERTTERVVCAPVAP